MRWRCPLLPASPLRVISRQCAHCRGNPFSLAGTCPKRETVLPPCCECLSRSCFATARERRSCGAERPPSSATGSGGALRSRGYPAFSPKTGCNRGIVCRLCFRAETLRLALHGAGGEVFAPSSRRSLGNPTGARGPPWPFQLGRVKGGEEIGIFPSLAAFLLSLFFGPNKEK